ncbi:hypothetical protein CDLVIII_5306 [Clostridium sp. DL-VIII]|uniref:hypothetical protein n=1 Tax=Clostridium sp. DL-VIII TaxID=641107 RepID=UPI00023B02EE|nr:hypothetical protein [Clostridium sp. DL-VIII]EHJ01788.1 hypothetical protein CDLVIII_5306 [Clostridium sp. DL-VIII]
MEDIEVVQYSEVEEAFKLIKSKKLEKNDDYFISFEMDLKSFDETSLRRLLFDYKILIFKDGKEENADFIIYKVPELEEDESEITIWAFNTKNIKFLSDTINKIKKEYSFYSWSRIKLDILNCQSDKINLDNIKGIGFEKDLVINSNKEENNRILYRLYYEREER